MIYAICDGTQSLSFSSELTFLLSLYYGVDVLRVQVVFSLVNILLLLLLILVYQCVEAKIFLQI